MKSDYIHPRIVIFGPEYREFMFGEADIFKKLANFFDHVDKAFRTYFLETGKIFVMNYFTF